ncbi:hypothetical protein AXF42_Ash013326 [Apostasia shenzhenica]|uniref:DUF6817 domain-containing protein n=1 Tax=Apostasia shenzhenica TaxID=1088818 RepID=A0A2I0BBM6_9ASPA|nr:hypothetical protein AXF42_Ash013326 [Apostasia shenzhenica]
MGVQTQFTPKRTNLNGLTRTRLHYLRLTRLLRRLPLLFRQINPQKPFKTLTHLGHPQSVFFSSPTMPSFTSSSSSADPLQRDFASLLAAALPFLRDDPDAVSSDPSLPSLLAALRHAGAGECWHKHGTFLAHLAGVHRILTLWNAPQPVARCGLYHSAYSNSYVNLAIFPPNSASRAELQASLGADAERLVHLFCVIPRQPLIHDLLLFRYSDAELADHLAASANPARSGPDEPWRRKLCSLLPPQGIVVKHIRTGENVPLSRRLAAVFLLMTMADFSDQLFGFQDRLFENNDGRMEFTRSNVAGALWPGDGRPGLWMNSVSRMGAIYRLIAREEEIYLREKGEEEEQRDNDIELVIPPVFENCTRVLSPEEQRAARDLYWEAAAGGGGGCGEGGEKAEKLLRESVERNPFVGEPHVVLAQVYLGMGRWEAAEAAAEKGLRLILEWGSPWDKRVTWEGWVAWGRVLLMKAREKDWPKSPWGVLNLGLVR